MYICMYIHRISLTFLLVLFNMQYLKQKSPYPLHEPRSAEVCIRMYMVQYVCMSAIFAENLEVNS